MSLQEEARERQEGKRIYASSVHVSWLNAESGCCLGYWYSMRNLSWGLHSPYQSISEATRQKQSTQELFSQTLHHHSPGMLSDPTMSKALQSAYQPSLLQSIGCCRIIWSIELKNPIRQPTLGML